MNQNPYATPQNTSLETSTRTKLKGTTPQTLAQTGARLSLAAGFSLLVYSLAVAVEAAHEAKPFAYNDPITIGKLIDALRVTRLEDVLNVEMSPLGVLSTTGMILVILFTVVKRRQVPTIVILCYLPALLLLYGWLGLLIVILLPIPSLGGVIDGEFVSDGGPRLAACGLWAAVLIIAMLFRWLRGMRLNPITPEPNTL
jgi:hypothetical protein